MPGGDDDIDSKAGKIQIQVQNTDTGYIIQIQVYNTDTSINYRYRNEIQTQV